MQQDKKRTDEERYKYELAEKEHEKTRKREEYLSSMGRTGKNSRGVINANYVYMLEEQKKRISQKDLRHQEKVLRDSCLVMGHVNDKFLAWRILLQHLMPMINLFDKLKNISFMWHMLSVSHFLD